MTDHDDDHGWRDVRPVALGVPWRAPGGGDPASVPPPEREILVETYDLGERFRRPLGGGIDFGEGSRAAVEREFREETGHEVVAGEYFGIAENVFDLGGAPHHELAVVYAVSFVDDAVRDGDELAVTESDGTERTASWHRLAALRDGPEPLYPDGIGGLVAGETDHLLPDDDRGG